MKRVTKSVTALLLALVLSLTLLPAQAPSTPKKRRLPPICASRWCPAAR